MTLRSEFVLWATYHQRAGKVISSYILMLFIKINGRNNVIAYNDREQRNGPSWRPEPLEMSVGPHAIFC